MLDEKQYKNLFELYYVALCYHARKFGLDYHQSEEVVQTVFVNLWKIRENLVINRSISSYLYQSVRNQSINFINQQGVLSKNKEEYLQKIERAELFSSITEEDSASALLASELEEQIEEAISKLPKKCHEIFLLSRKENLSIKEIADKLNISNNTVQKQISIAIVKLKEMLKYYLLTFWAIVNYFFQ